jgi:hypothetical protein
VATVSLLDRGMVYALAHIRGGQEMGRAWYDDGHLLNKKNSFTDFIDVTRQLVKEGYAAPGRVAARGGSAGGLLMGAVANMAPKDYRVIIAQVPFVDVVTTMLDDSIPLTTNEYDEWGNPADRKYYDYMLSYSPYDNVARQDYPAIFVGTGLWDSQVQYYEPTKWVARLRTHKTDTNPLVYRINMEAGHGGKSGRFQRYREGAEYNAFMLEQLGVGDGASRTRRSHAAGGAGLQLGVGLLEDLRPRRRHAGQPLLLGTHALDVVHHHAQVVEGGLQLRARAAQLRHRGVALSAQAGLGVRTLLGELRALDLHPVMLGEQGGTLALQLRARIGDLRRPVVHAHHFVVVALRRGQSLEHRGLRTLVLQVLRVGRLLALELRQGVAIGLVHRVEGGLGGGVVRVRLLDLVGDAGGLSRGAAARALGGGDVLQDFEGDVAGDALGLAIFDLGLESIRARERAHALRGNELLRGHRRGECEGKRQGEQGRGQPGHGELLGQPDRSSESDGSAPGDDVQRQAQRNILAP